MIVLKVFLIVLEVICSLLLIAVVLLQRSKGEGLGLAFGAEMGESLFGARASNVLVKATVWLGIIFLANTILLARLYSKGTARSLLSDAPAPVEQPATLPVGQQPAQPMSAQPAAQPVSPAPMMPAVPAAPGPLAPMTLPSATPAPVQSAQ